jgi:hypothetical protein
LRVAFERQGNVHDKDNALALYAPGELPTQPTADPNRQKVMLLELSPGVNFRLPWLGGHRLGFEFGWPVYQHRDGPQLQRKWRVTAGWRWQF